MSISGGPGDGLVAKAQDEMAQETLDLDALLR